MLNSAILYCFLNAASVNHTRQNDIAGIFYEMHFFFLLLLAAALIFLDCFSGSDSKFKNDVSIYSPLDSHVKTSPSNV